MKSLINVLPLSLIVFFSFSLRLINLGYSDYQGDEIKSFYILESGQKPYDFFMQQRKGPGQFFVTYLTGLITPGYTNEFLVRLPFALAGALSVYIFYLFVKLHFGSKLAFYAAFFFSTNGLFVGLSRISQYQAFVMLFSMLSILSFSYLLDTGKIKFLYYGFLSWAFGSLFHYDAVLIFPLVAFLLRSWLKLNFKARLKTLIFSSFLFFVVVGSFYVPFTLSITKDTMDYWSGRITGNVSSKISSSRYLFSVYQPIFSIHIYYFLAILGFIVLTYNLLQKFLRIPPYLKAFDLLLSAKSFWTMVAVFIWFLSSFVFLEILVKVPGTHIFNYIIPGCIFIGLGLVFIENFLQLFKKIIIPEILTTFLISIIFSFLYIQSYVIFVDHSKEYPWQEKEFFVWMFPALDKNYHLSLFGFPYYRNWEEISDFVKKSSKTDYFFSNERDSITKYYINKKLDTELADAFIYIKYPQNINNPNPNEKGRYWMSRYRPDYTYSKDGEDIASVYLTKPGSAKDLSSQGY